MSEHLDIEATLDRVLRTGDVSHQDLLHMRAGLDAFAAAVSVTVPVSRVQDSELALPGRMIPLRTYTPQDATDATLAWFHGGGYVSGNLDAIDPICRVLANAVGCTVLSVGYRLAPEAPYPAGLEDCLAAVEWAAARAPGALTIGGDSAGGGLSAAVARRTQAPIAGQLLLCPWLDTTLRSPSVHTKGVGFGLTVVSLRGFARMYLPSGIDPTDEGASPLRGKNFRDLPPTIVVTAGDDPLCDQGEEYVDKIQAAGGRAQFRRWEGMVHGFVGMTAELPQAIEALTWAATGLRGLLAAD